MGDMLAAFRAGKTPKTIPTRDDTPNATSTEVALMTAGKNRLIKRTMTAETKIPPSPPIRDSRTDSVRN